MNFLWPGCQQYIGLRRQKIAFGSTLLSPVLCPWRHSRSLGCENEVLNLSLCCLTSEEFGDNHYASSPLYYGWDVTFYFSSIYERKFHINITSFNAGQISTVNPISKILLFMFYIFYWHFIIPKKHFPWFQLREIACYEFDIRRLLDGGLNYRITKKSSLDDESRVIMIFFLRSIVHEC